MSMIQFYELNESEVLTSSLDPGSLICCKDSTNIYMVPTDPALGTTPVKMGETIKYLTDQQREELLAPINGKQYFCYDTGKLWFYLNEWICINKDKGLEGSQFSIENVTIKPGDTVNVAFASSKTTSTAEFIPDLSLYDLYNLEKVVITCKDGSVDIACDDSLSYPIIGRLLITV